MEAVPERPRPKSSFSFRSNKSDKSSASKPPKNKPIVDLSRPVSEREKRRTRLSGTSYADPTRAINEEQPAMRALEQNTLLSIRSLQHKDASGNIITDADASNPSRPRMERPLDTIRSFEAAVDNGHKRRTQVARTETAPGNVQTGYSSRRSSWVGNDQPVNPRYHPGGGYNNGYSSHDNSSRLNSLRHASYQENYGPAGYPMPKRHQGYQQSYQQGYQRGSPAPPPHQGSNRMHSDYGVYPVHGYQDSYDTVHTGSSSEPWTNSTDPSSENSSVDRIHAANMKQDYNDAYGGAPPGHPPYGRASPRSAPIMEEHSQHAYQNDPQQQHQNRMPNHNPYRSQQQQPSPTRDRPSMPPLQRSEAELFASQQFGGSNNSKPPAPPQHQQNAQYQQAPPANVQRPPMQLNKPQPQIPRQQQAQPYQGSPLSPTRSRPMWPQQAPPAPSSGARYNNQQRPSNRLQRQPSAQQQGGKDKGDKRKSWFKRTFSRD